VSRIVIALGGNALGDDPAEQRERIAAAAPSLVGLIAQGHEIIVSHGNGPQVGAIQLAFDLASRQTDRVPAVPLPECTAMSQGYIGYHLQQGLLAELRRVGMPWHVATVVTQVEVDAADPAFDHPTKPIGAFCDEPTARARMAAEPGLIMVEDSGRGWRTVVASPKPLRIVERDSILNLLDHEFIVIACGGGGVPVVRDEAGDLQGVAAVIDKDFASAALAEAVGADVLFILTAVDRVAIRFGTPEQEDLDELDLATAQRYVDEGQFGAGSMLPKVQAAMRFAASGPGRRAVICSLEQAPLAMRGLSGTVVHAGLPAQAGAGRGSGLEGVAHR
jgi:carbamate kinase